MLDAGLHSWTVETMASYAEPKTARDPEWKFVTVEVLALNAFAFATLGLAWLLGSFAFGAPVWIKVILILASLYLVLCYAAGHAAGMFQSFFIAAPLAVATFIGLFFPPFWPVMLLIAVLPSFALSSSILYEEIKATSIKA